MSNAFSREKKWHNNAPRAQRMRARRIRLNFRVTLIRLIRLITQASPRGTRSKWDAVSGRQPYLFVESMRLGLKNNN